MPDLRLDYMLPCLDGGWPVELSNNELIKDTPIEAKNLRVAWRFELEAACSRACWFIAFART
jgi:hypothetical protein